MGSQTVHKIPVIHFSENMKPGSDSWISAREQVQYGLEEYGCFEMVYEKFPLQLRNSIFDAFKDLFALPKETKMRKATDRVGALGYADEPPSAPLCESIGIDAPNTLQGAQLFTSTMWPQGNDTFLKTLHSFGKMIAEDVYEAAIRMMLESYGVERLFDSFKESSFHVIRLQKYRTRTMDENSNDDDFGLGFRPHEDSNFLTILYENSVNGLEIKTKDGQWIDVKPTSSASFIVLAGNVLTAWSNDRVRSCMHRVVAKEEKVRYSIGSFTFTEGLIHVPQEFVDKQHPLLYKPIDCFGYGLFFLSQTAKSACPIKAFCGI